MDVPYQARNGLLFAKAKLERILELHDADAASNATSIRNLVQATLMDLNIVLAEVESYITHSSKPLVGRPHGPARRLPGDDASLRLR